MKRPTLMDDPTIRSIRSPVEFGIITTQFGNNDEVRFGNDGFGIGSGYKTLHRMRWMALFSCESRGRR